MTPSPLEHFLPSGDLWTRIHRNFARLEESKYYPENVFQREKEHKKWPGDTEGRTLLAWILLSRTGRRAPRYLDDMLALWPAEVNEHGYFGHLYTDGISEQQLSSHGWILQALAELERLRPGGPARELALPVIEKLFLPTAGAYAAYPIDPSERETAGEYSGSHLKQIGPWILSTDVGCFAIGMTGLIDACEAFDLSSRLEPLISEMIDRFLAIDLAAIQIQTHATLTALRGLVRWTRITGNDSLWDEIEFRYRLYTDLAWTETYANFNWFGRPLWTEPCAMVDSLIVAMDLWRHTRRDLYLEHAQLIWFNALGHGQRANGGFGCDNCPGADGESDLFFKTPESHWCCSMRGAEGLARMCQYQVFQEGETLFLPFGLPGDFTRGGTALRVASRYPHAAEWVLSNLGDNPLNLQIFLPSWIEGIDTVRGRAHLRLAPGETATLRGSLTQSVRPLLSATTTACPNAPTGVIRMSGPLVLARRGDEWVPICDDYLRGDMSREHSRKTLVSRDGAGTDGQGKLTGPQGI